MGVNHDQFSHFCRSRPGSSAVIHTLNGGDFGPNRLFWWLLGFISAWDHEVSVGKWCVRWCCGGDEVIEWV